MATGDYRVFDEALAYVQDGGWEPSDDIKVAVLDNTTPPTLTDVTPGLADYTEVGTAGSYVAGGISLGTWGAFITQTGGVATGDTPTNPSWPQDLLNDVDAHWGLVYNDTQPGKPAIGFLDLGGPVDMTAGDLTFTWNALGLYTITRV